MSNRSLDRVLGPTYLDGLHGWTAEALRERRTEVQRLEEAASFLRRMAQARLDICEAELARRSGGTDDLSDLVDRLPAILAEGTARGSGFGGRLPGGGPTTDQELWALARLEAVCGQDALAQLPELTDELIRARSDALTVLEREVSVERRRLHELLDRLQAELVERYKSGRATIDGLLR